MALGVRDARRRASRTAHGARSPLGMRHARPDRDRARRGAFVRETSKIRFQRRCSRRHGARSDVENVRERARNERGDRREGTHLSLCRARVPWAPDRGVEWRHDAYGGKPRGRDGARRASESGARDFAKQDTMPSANGSNASADEARPTPFSSARLTPSSFETDVIDFTPFSRAPTRNARVPLALAPARGGRKHGAQRENLRRNPRRNHT